MVNEQGVKSIKCIIWIGIGIVLIGFIYDCYFAGIPYQDPSKQMQLEYVRNSLIASSIMEIGLWVVTVGIVVRIVIFINSKSKKKK